jgi:hypothetical protein
MRNMWRRMYILGDVRCISKMADCIIILFEMKGRNTFYTKNDKKNQ